MTKLSAAAFVQGCGLGVIMGSQVVAAKLLEPVILVLAAGVVLLAGFGLEQHARNTEVTPDAE